MSPSTDTLQRNRDTGRAGRMSAGAGTLLRTWRRVRRMSQLDLALEAEISPRHLSFVETGRSRPSREMVLRLAEALDIPLRDRNDLLAAAGFAPSFRETGLSDPEMTLVHEALARMLAQQEPYPAVVQNRGLDILEINAAARRTLGAFLAGPPPKRLNVLDLVFDPAQLRPAIANWEEVARALLLRHQREIAAHPDDALSRTLARALAYPDVPRDWRAADPRISTPPVLTMDLVRDGTRLSWFTTLTTFGTPQDITLQELHIECFFPADPATEAWAKAAAREP